MSEGPHDEMVTVRDHWDALEIAHPIEFVDVPPSWHVVVEDGLRYLMRSQAHT